ncbi:MAG: response regulator [Eubacteriaceae bacterium]
MDKNYNVLFVDDEPNILNSIKRGLLEEKYNKYFATGGKKALEIMAKIPISVVVTDMRMPEMNGLTLLKIVKEKYPDTVKIILSGYAQIQQVLATINQVDVYKFITKPWDMENDFIDVIRSALEQYRLKEEKETLKHDLEKKNIAYQNILKHIESVITLSKSNTELLGKIGTKLCDDLSSKISENIDQDYLLINLQQFSKIFKALTTNISAGTKTVLLDDFISSLMQTIKDEGNIKIFDVDNRISKDTRINMNIPLFRAIILFSVEVISQHKDYLMLIIKKDIIEENNIELTFLFSNTKQNEKINSLISNDFIIDNMNTALPEIFEYLKGSYVCTHIENNIAEKFIIPEYQI